MNKKSKRLSGDAGEPFFVGMVVRVEKLSDTARGKWAIEVDAIDTRYSGEEISNAISNPNFYDPFALVRIVTTRQKFSEIFGEMPTEETWVGFRLTSKTPSTPLAFLAFLSEAGYSTQELMSLSDATTIQGPDERPPSHESMGAAVTSSTQKSLKVIEYSEFPASASCTAHDIIRTSRLILDVDKVLVRDVGHASFNTLLSKNNKEVAHFDVGWPVSFNGRTCPKAIPIINNDAPVFLSHWDWDHLHAFYKCPKLQSVDWFVPIQRLGPGAKRVANILMKSGRLHAVDLTSRSTEAFGQLTLIRCVGRKSNNSGFAACIQLNSGREVLLPGDANYEDIVHPWNAKKYDYLCVTHHGAKFSGVPAAVGVSPGRAVISVGNGNVYKHPKIPYVIKHARIGWNVSKTSGRRGVPRGNQILGP